LADQRCSFRVKDREGDDTFLHSEECGVYLTPKAPSPDSVMRAWAGLLHEVFDIRVQNADPEGLEYAAVKRLAAIMSDPKTPLDMRAAITSIIHDPSRAEAIRRRGAPTRRSANTRRPNGMPLGYAESRRV
jgi:hypothetical protein